MSDESDGILCAAQSGGSELYWRAMGLLLEGRVGEALEVVDGEKLQRLIAEAKEKRARDKKWKTETETAIGEAVQAWLLRARLLTMHFRFSEAVEAYRAAIEALPESFEVSRALARLNGDLRELEGAICPTWPQRLTN
jgi:hypothetical protein